MGQVYKLPNTEVPYIAKLIMKTAEELRKFPNELYKRASEYAAAEKAYRVALAQAEHRLKSEGYPATLINDLARGEVADLKEKRDLAEKLYDACKESARVKQAEMSGLQSVYRHLDEG